MLKGLKRIKKINYETKTIKKKSKDQKNNLTKFILVISFFYNLNNTF